MCEAQVELCVQKCSLHLPVGTHSPGCNSDDCALHHGTVYYCSMTVIYFDEQHTEQQGGNPCSSATCNVSDACPHGGGTQDNNDSNTPEWGTLYKLCVTHIGNINTDACSRASTQCMACSGCLAVLQSVHGTCSNCSNCSLHS